MQPLVLNEFFRLPGILQLVVFLVLGLATMLPGLLLMRFCSRWRTVGQYVPVAPFFVAVASIYALFLAFHANGIWMHKKQAEHDFLDTATSIKRLDDMLSPGGLDLPDARARLHDYVRYVFKDEWKMHNRMPSRRADDALRDLQSRVTRASFTLPTAIASQLNALLDDVADTRTDRLWLGGNFVSVISWWGVLGLGLLTSLSIAAVHLDRPRAGAVALLLFMLGTTVAYWTLGLVVDPYGDIQHLNPMAWMAIDP